MTNPNPARQEAWREAYEDWLDTLSDAEYTETSDEDGFRAGYLSHARTAEAEIGRPVGIRSIATGDLRFLVTLEYETPDEARKVAERLNAHVKWAS